VHGCVDELCDLLRAVQYKPGDVVLLLGDLVAKGPHPTKVVRLAMEIGALSVRGNHDHEVVRQGMFHRRKQEPATTSPYGARGSNTAKEATNSQSSETVPSSTPSSTPSAPSPPSRRPESDRCQLSQLAPGSRTVVVLGGRGYGSIGTSWGRGFGALEPHGRTRALPFSRPSDAFS
jgi:hypothetical protein